ncbi:TetR/AcrR family transcriptional regulator [Syntrophomonas erecta]
MDITESNRGSKRDAILKAAVEVFSEKGYYNARMEEIAATAGAGKGTIYEYFDSKLKLFQEIMETGWNFFSRSTHLEDLMQKSFQEQIELIIAEHMRFCLEHKKLTRVVFIDANVIDEELKEWVWSIRLEKEQLLKGLIEQGIENGELRVLDSGVASKMICAIIPYFAMQLVLDEDNSNPDELAREISRNIMTGMGKNHL